MITIREKDILFISINVVIMLTAISYGLMERAIMICGSLFFTDQTLSVYEGFVYVLYETATISVKVAAIIVILIDIWWLYRMIRDVQKGYWRENL